MFEKYFTKNLKPGEELIQIIRPDFSVVIPRFSVALVALLLPFFLLFLLVQMRWGLFAFVLLVFFGIFLFARALLLWGFHAFLLTTRRIVDFDQNGLFSRSVSETLYENIVDVSYVQKGVWATLFHLGDVLVHTSGPKTNIVLEDVKYPDVLKEKINDLIEEQRSGTIKL